jgi:S-adenosylmethionine:tRNA ribosyltransferase-isomerase
MKLSDFDFDLPERLIALRPARPRSSARLLVAEAGGITDRHVFDLPLVLRPGDRLVLNDTRVIPARLTGLRQRGETAARIEVTLLEQTAGLWSALVKPLRKLRDGEVVVFSDALSGVIEGRRDGQGLIRFNLTDAAFDAALAEVGVMPLPPYIAALRPPMQRI